MNFIAGAIIMHLTEVKKDEDLMDIEIIGAEKDIN